MSRILVVCYSRCGTTLEVATRIAERCGADLELIKDKTPRDGFLGWLRSAFEARMRRQPCTSSVASARRWTSSVLRSLCRPQTSVIWSSSSRQAHTD